jgi:predicted RNase H-like HicB family nuclease
MSRPNYRVVLSFDSERKVFTARIPELPHCTAEGATRGEAITRVEEELDALLQNQSERGGRLPRALDDADNDSDAKLTGEVKVKVSVGLQRELIWQAHNEGVDVSQLASEMLSAALEQRRHGGRGPRRHGGNDNIGNEAPRGRGDFADRDRQRGANAARFHDMLEDRAAFVDYVRKLDSDGGRGRSEGRPHGEGRPRSGGDRPHGEARPHPHPHPHPHNDHRGGGFGRRPNRPHGQNDRPRGDHPRRGPEGHGEGSGPGNVPPKPHSPSESES